MKKIVGILVCMLLITTVLPVTGNTDVKSTSMPISSGNTLYVGGSGPNNYTSIKEAIDNSSNGDTVYVYDDSSPYKESNIIIEKSITLIGEDRNTTVIDGENNSEIIVIIYTGSVRISGFTIRNCSGSMFSGAITVIMSSYNNISGNIFVDNSPDIIIGRLDFEKR